MRRLVDQVEDEGVAVPEGGVAPSGAVPRGRDFPKGRSLWAPSFRGWG